MRLWAAAAWAAEPAKLPKLIDLGADKCIPCKAMAPILKDLKAEYAGRMDVEFIDVWKNPEPGKAYKIKLIPTQIFFDASGKERFRHEGFFGKEDILGKWKELGVDLKAKASAGIVRETPVAADTRPRESVCFMCDEDVNPKTKTVVKGQSEQRVLCGPHCYFIYLSSIVGADPKAEEAKVSVTDWASGNLVAATTASYLYGMDAKGRATIKAFADKDAATKEQQSSAGNLVSWDVLRVQGTGDALRVLRPGGVSRGCLRREVRDDARLRLLHALLDGRGGAAEAGHRSRGQGRPDRRAHPREDARRPDCVAGTGDRHCVVRAEEGPGWEVGFGRLLQAGILRERSQPAEVAGGASGDDGAANHASRRRWRTR